MSSKKLCKLILGDENIVKLSICFIEVMNRKRNVEGKLGHVVQIDVCRKRDPKSL